MSPDFNYEIHSFNQMSDILKTFVREILNYERQYCLIHYSAFFGKEGHVALDRNPGSGYDTLLLQMIPGDLLSAFPHRQFNTLPGLY